MPACQYIHILVTLLNIDIETYMNLKFLKTQTKLTCSSFVASENISVLSLFSWHYSAQLSVNVLLPVDLKMILMLGPFWKLLIVWLILVNSSSLSCVCRGLDCGFLFKFPPHTATFRSSPEGLIRVIDWLIDWLIDLLTTSLVIMVCML